MSRHREPTGQDLLRLDAIAKHLGVKSRYPQPSFMFDVKTACLARISPIIEKMLPCTGEQIAKGLGEHLCVTFEEVHGAHDVSDIEDRYLRGKREIGFAQLREEMNQPGVDAVLFQRIHAKEQDPDRWVAVLNLKDSAARAYWNRFHELSHRIAEPPQQILPFRRHQLEAANPVEVLIDAVAAELAFYGPAFRPLVQNFARAAKLDFEVIAAIRKHYAPTASLLATINAVVKYWPRPAAALTAEWRGRRHSPNKDLALRLSPQSSNDLAAQMRLSFIPNMRVPTTSPIYRAYQTDLRQSGSELLGAWTTSDGSRLASLDVYTSAERIGEKVYGVVSV